MDPSIAARTSAAPAVDPSIAARAGANSAPRTGLSCRIDALGPIVKICRNLGAFIRSDVARVAMIGSPTRASSTEPRLLAAGVWRIVGRNRPPAVSNASNHEGERSDRISLAERS